MEILTEELLLVPCSLDLAKSLILHKKELAKRSPILIPEDWPSEMSRGIMPFYIERLERDCSEYGWGLWLIIHHKDKKMIGDFYIYSKPDETGMVNFDFRIDPDYGMENGYEAVSHFFDWLFEQKEVKRVSTECHIEHDKTIGILSRLGLICRGKEHSFLSWSLAK
ncbi:GNAT family N-acetyltransferase [Bacillus sp. FJAT-42376]|uniref:GNAT family N-acetyltransferase n=1 Tax=Bacillus sp. FJAT-42376 TaxID=2014076 RepID=UPI0013DDA31C|nr:GNAT family N-acetyltransferase [Bacillus sp. FJAT-42376]